MRAEMNSERTATVERNTKETQIRVCVNLDGTGKSDVNTGLGFLDHMLDQLTFHGLLDLEVRCKGDLHIDGHHSTEDIALALGQAIREALGDKAGHRAFWTCLRPRGRGATTLRDRPLRASGVCLSG